MSGRKSRTCRTWPWAKDRRKPAEWTPHIDCKQMELFAPWQAPRPGGTLFGAFGSVTVMDEAVDMDYLDLEARIATAVSEQGRRVGSRIDNEIMNTLVYGTSHPEILAQGVNLHTAQRAVFGGLEE